MREVGRASSAEHPFRAGRSRRIEADGDDAVERRAGPARRHLETVGDLLQTNVWTFSDECRILAEPFDEELLPAAIEWCEVHGGATQANSRDTRPGADPGESS